MAYAQEEPPPDPPEAQPPEGDAAPAGGNEGEATPAKEEGDDKPRPQPLYRIPKAEKKASPIDSRGVRIGTEVDIRQIFENRARYRRNGDHLNARSELENLVDLAGRLNLKNMPLVSAALMHEVRQALREQGTLPDSAVDAVNKATRLSPDLISAHFLRARVFLAYDGNLGEAVGALADGVTAMVRGVRNRIALVSALAGILGLACLVLLAIFALVQLGKNARFMAHDLVRRLPDWVTDFQGMLFILMVALAPFILGYGPLVTLTLWLAILLPYQSFKERVVSGVGIGLLAMSTFALAAFAPLVTFYGSTSDALITASTEAFSSDAERRLAQLAKNGRVDHEIAVVLGLRARYRGDFKSAEHWYRKALSANSRSVLAQNNLGKLLYARQAQDEAREAFKAATFGRKHAEPFLNLASLELDEARFDQAKGFINTARSIDPARTAEYNAMGSGLPTTQKLLEVPYDESGLWLRATRASPESAVVAKHIWSMLGGKTPMDSMPIVCVALAAFGLLLNHRRKQLQLSQPCVKCGRAASPFVSRQYCDQCRTIYLKAVAVDPSTRVKKERRIRFYQRRLRWTERILAVVPGAGDVFSGRTVAGVILLFVFALSVSTLIWVDQMVFHPWATGAHGIPLGLAAVLGFVMILIGLVSFKRSLELR